MTILVLELRVPVIESAHDQRVLWANGAISQERAVLDALGEVAPHLLIYVMSFLTLGIFWLAQQSQLEGLAAVTRRLTWIHLGLLFAVTLLPFSTALLGEYIDLRLALVVYWLNLLLLGVLLWSALRYAARHQLLAEAFSPLIFAASERRIVRYQILYAAAVATAALSTYLAIGLLVTLQLISVFSPRVKVLTHLG